MKAYEITLFLNFCYGARRACMTLVGVLILFQYTKIEKKRPLRSSLSLVK